MGGHDDACRGALDEIARVLDCRRIDGTDYLSHFLYLVAVLQSQNSGTKGAGLTGGIEQEKIWIDMLQAGSSAFHRAPPPGTTSTDDYDYYWESYPLSHKTIGWRGNGDLALAWSKNPKGGRQRTRFESSIVVVVTRQPSPRSRSWDGIGQGVYVIPVTALTGVTLKANNKSDSIFAAEDVRRCLRESRNAGLHLPFSFDPERGRSRCVSIWHAGPDAIRPVQS